MKNNNCIALVSIILFCVLTYSCENIDDNSSSSGNKLGAGQIELKGYPDTGYPGWEKKSILTFIATAGQINIDWGDNCSIDKLSPNGLSRAFTHEYNNQNLYTVLIDTENLTYLDTRMKGGYSELRFGNCPNLKTIDCYGHNLTVLSIENAQSLTKLDCSGNYLKALDVSKCPSLKEINCAGNDFTALAFNSLFNGLPVRKESDYAIIRIGWIDIGMENFDMSIATKKGWEVSPY